jgi:hypothetical protein
MVTRWLLSQQAAAPSMTRCLVVRRPPGPAAAADPVRGHVRAGEDHAVLAAADPGRPGRDGGVVRLGRPRFGLVSPLPGIWPSLHLDTTITLPVGVEAYAAYALRPWLATVPAVSPWARAVTRPRQVFPNTVSGRRR